GDGTIPDLPSPCHVSPRSRYPRTAGRSTSRAWSVHRFKAGKVVEQRGMNDVLLLLMQLGAIPTPSLPSTASLVGLARRRVSGSLFPLPLAALEPHLVEALALRA